MAVRPVFNLSQLQVLLTIVETGSFTAAAKRLNRTTSVVTYTIDTLEAQLGLRLFHRGAARRGVLTEEGEAVVAEARSVAYGAGRFRARVSELREGVESEITLAVDEMFPVDRLTSALRSLSERFPAIGLRLHSDVLGGVEHLVRFGQCGVGIGGIAHMNGEGMTRRQIEGVNIIPVAASSHALARAAENGSAQGREHTQIAITDRDVVDRRRFGILGEKVWRTTSLASKHDLLRAGLGWGGMPEPMVREDIETGRLARLDLADWRGGQYEMQIVHRDDAPPGPAGRWLIEYLANQSDPDAAASIG